MAALQATLLLILATACGLTAAQSSASCELVVDVVYPSGGSPYPVCSSQCDSDQSGIWYQGVAMQRISSLRDEYQLMVAANYQNGDLVSCSLVPYKTTEQLVEEAAGRKAAVAECLGLSSDEGQSSDQLPVEESAPDADATVPQEAPAVEPTTPAPTTPEPTTSELTTSELTTPEPTTPEPTTPEPTTPEPTTPEPTTPAPTTPELITPEPTTPEPTTPEPTTTAPTTPEPTTPAPSTPEPTIPTTTSTTTTPTTTTPAPTTTTTTPAPTTTTTTTTPAPTTTKTTTTTTTTTTPKPIVYTCPSGHYKFKDASCYMVPTGSYVWDDAYKYCKDRGYTLARIESLDEQNFVAGLITEDTWIDLNDRDSEGKFRFTDGRSTPFTYWDSGEPNDTWWNEDCVEMRKEKGFRWNDKNCGNNRRFVCEKPTTVA